jgi:DNA-binding MarR family transcriptional regulator
MMTAPRLVARLHKATHQVGLYVHRELSQLAISQAEAHVLSHLSARGPCSIADVHHSFGHRRSTLTSILNRLEDRGLITRALHPDDRRSYLLRLTGEEGVRSLFAKQPSARSRKET